jgi:hypothetical protein
MECLEAGQAPTTVNLSKRLGISRVALWKLQRRWPRLDAWCDEVMRDANVHYWGAIQMRMGILGEQGSVAHAEMYCKMQANVWARGAQGDDDESPSDSRFVTHVNILVPHPQLPNGGRMPVFGPEPALGPKSAFPMPNMQDIPTVAVR